MLIEGSQGRDNGLMVNTGQYPPASVSCHMKRKRGLLVSDIPLFDVAILGQYASIPRLLTEVVSVLTTCCK